MSLALFVQYLIVWLLVSFSAWIALRKLAAPLTDRWLVRICMCLERSGYLRLAKCLRPSADDAGGCGGACSTCRGCGVWGRDSSPGVQAASGHCSHEYQSAESMPLHFR